MAEGESVTIKVVLSADPEREVVIPLSRGESEAGVGDYSVPRSVTFQSGETEKTFMYSATDDSVDDDDETTILRLINARLLQGVTAGTTDTATITIGDNDMPEVTVGFENSYYGVTEGGQVTINVGLSQDPERTVTVWLRTRNQRDTTPDDYSGVPASLTFDAGDTRKSFTVTAAQNDDDDLDVIKISLVIPVSYRVQYGAKDVALLFFNESVTTATVPPAPTALRAQAHSQTQINLAWDAPRGTMGAAPSRDTRSSCPPTTAAPRTHWSRTPPIPTLPTSTPVWPPGTSAATASPPSTPPAPARSLSM